MRIFIYYIGAAIALLLFMLFAYRFVVCTKPADVMISFIVATITFTVFMMCAISGLVGYIGAVVRAHLSIGSVDIRSERKEQ
jgi:hypothetical protein